MTSLYRSLFPLLFFGFLFFGYPFSGKIREGFRLRRIRLRAPYLKKLQQCYWVHAASGEYEYARPLIKELKNQNPDIPVVVTFFSPTYLSVIEKDGLVDFAVPLPFDFPGALRSFIRKVSPRALFIARTDLWPEMLHQARVHKIPSILFSYHQNEAKGFFAVRLRRWLLSQLSHVDCVRASSVEWVRRHASVSVTSFGDTRFDRVQERKANPRAMPFTLPEGGLGQRVLVLGSTWSEDEDQLFPALEVARDVLDLIVIAPHEPTPAHVDALKARFDRLGFEWQLFSEWLAEGHGSGGSAVDGRGVGGGAGGLASGLPTKQVLILDRVGYLFEFYRFSDLAFVGNSFKKHAVHSVMEPLAFGNRVLVGPKIQNNGEAVEFSGMIVDGLPAVQLCSGARELGEAIIAHFESPIEIRAHRRNIIATESLHRSGASKKLLAHLHGAGLI